MDEMITKATVPAPEKHHKKMVFRIVGILCGVIVVAAAAIILYRKYHPVVVTPEQTLEALRTSSAPDTKTTDQKAATMAKLQKSSKQSTVTSEQQLQILDTLSK